MKHLLPMKATPLDDDAFRLLALPYGGPIPYPGAPRGADLDRQWFTEGTDFALRRGLRVPVTWHHGVDRTMGKAVLGEAGDPTEDEDGVWVTVWLNHGERRVNLVKRLAEKGAAIFGSSEAMDGTSRIRAGKALLPWRRDIPGEIARWHYVGQTLSTSPQNTNSVLQPIKATLADLAADELAPTAAFFDDLSRFLDELQTGTASELSADGDEAAKAGRVLASRNEARLRQGIDAIERAGWDPVVRKRALMKFAEVLDELDKTIHSHEDTTP